MQPLPEQECGEAQPAPPCIKQELLGLLAGDAGDTSLLRRRVYLLLGRRVHWLLRRRVHDRLGHRRCGLSNRRCRLRVVWRRGSHCGVLGRRGHRGRGIIIGVGLLARAARAGQQASGANHEQDPLHPMTLFPQADLEWQTVSIGPTTARQGGFVAALGDARLEWGSNNRRTIFVGQGHLDGRQMPPGLPINLPVDSPATPPFPLCWRASALRKEVRF
jgi:hypothetical protein